MMKKYLLLFLIGTCFITCKDKQLRDTVEEHSKKWDKHPLKWVHLKNGDSVEFGGWHTHIDNIRQDTMVTWFFSTDVDREEGKRTEMLLNEQILLFIECTANRNTVDDTTLVSVKDDSLPDYKRKVAYDGNVWRLEDEGVWKTLEALRE